MSCGTPVVGFEMGFLFGTTIIKNGYNGYVAKMKDSVDLSDGILKILRLSPLEYIKMSNNARITVEENLSESFFLHAIEDL
jgi:glycosyltransferase involved in cell wall biosynthesis